MKLYVLIAVLLFSIPSNSQNDSNNKYFVDKLSYSSAQVSSNDIEKISMKFKTQFIVAESEKFNLVRQDVIDKTSNTVIGKYSEKFININKEGKIKIKFELNRDKIVIFKGNKILSEGMLHFQENELKEIVFYDAVEHENFTIIKAWATLTTINKLYGYDVNQSVREGIIHGIVIGSFI